MARDTGIMHAYDHVRGEKVVKIWGFSLDEIAAKLDEQARDKCTYAKLLKLEAFLRIKHPEALAEYNLWWEISRKLEEAVGETK